jgi:hypothetical protein
MNEYRVSTSSTYGVREIYHETFSFSSGSSLGVYVYGQAPDWMPNGTYYSWDSIHFFKDKSMTQPVLNGESVGEYYNYYQYLPFRSSSNVTAKQLDDYLIALGFTKKATYYGEPNASAMYGEGKAFTDGQLTYGVNALLVMPWDFMKAAVEPVDYPLKKTIFLVGVRLIVIRAMPICLKVLR